MMENPIKMNELGVPLFSETPNSNHLLEPCFGTPPDLPMERFVQDGLSEKNAMVVFLGCVKAQMKTTQKIRQHLRLIYLISTGSDFEGPSL